MLVYYLSFFGIYQVSMFYINFYWRIMGAIAYVDGSYNVKTEKFGYGVVFFTGASDKDGNLQELHYSQCFEHPELKDMRNVAGEIMGAGQAMKIARSLGIKELTIYHDYEGIAKWCTGEWKAKKEWTKKYKDFFDEISRDVNVSFIKVKGHSHDKYNDLADSLARKAVGN